MSQRARICRTGVIATLLRASMFVALHRDLFQAAGLERELPRFGHAVQISHS